ncbi:helix-turn-helix domain-containing protein [Companilactobacillus paralimentarius]|nr:helix-turn-helix transcriptional regulator [Companilactobacillus paralimentarius]QFR70120.1 helix-turn-helix domain-containing protein [Companilactobacillus paralimentarius]
MIVIKLKELLEKNNVSINELSDETGISRTSLTQLANGDSKMVRMETISKIMDFFSLDNITDLMEKISKYSYDVKQFKVDFKKKNISFEFSYKEDETNGSFKVLAPFIFENDIIKINF